MRGPAAIRLAEKRKAKAPTFREAAEKTRDGLRARWRNDKTEKIWDGVLAKRAYPAIGSKPVDAITPGRRAPHSDPGVERVKPEVARRLRQFMRATFRWCQAHGYVELNPAGEAIDGALPTMPAVKAHYRALPHQEVAAALETVEETGASMAAKHVPSGFSC